MKILLFILLPFSLYSQKSHPHNTASLMFDSVGSVPAHVTVGKFDDGSWSFEVVDQYGCTVAYQHKGEPLNIVNSEEAVRIMETCLKWEYQRFNDNTNKSIQIKDSIIFWNCLCFVGCDPKLGGDLKEAMALDSNLRFDGKNILVDTVNYKDHAK